MSLQRHIDGQLLDITSPEQVRAAGTVLARLHEALSSYPETAQLTELAPQGRTLPAKVTDWLAADHPGVPNTTLEVLRLRLADAPAQPLAVQLVHGDFRAANVLLDGSSVIAVLDLEEAGPDHRIVDLARSALLLGTRFHDRGPVTSEVRATFLKGYQSVCRLTDAELCWWDTLVLWFSLAMIPAGDDPTGWRHEVATVASCSPETAERCE